MREPIDLANLFHKGWKSKSFVSKNTFKSVKFEKIWKSASIKITKLELEIHPFSYVMEASNLSLENLKETNKEEDWSTDNYLSDSKSSSV